MPQLIANGLMSITSNKYLLLLLINIMLLFLGCIMDVAPLIIITTPILAPIATSLGMDLVQFGIMMLLNLYAACWIGAVHRLRGWQNADGKGHEDDHAVLYRHVRGADAGDLCSVVLVVPAEPADGLRQLKNKPFFRKKRMWN